jgi:hypothetical protein
VTTAVVIVAVALANGTLGHATSQSAIDRWGVGLEALRRGRLWTMLTGNALIDHPTAIISTIVLAVVATGACELRFGTPRTIFIWFLGTWAPLLVALLLLPIAHALGDAGAVRRLMESEVGSSTATWCCAGAVLGVPWRQRDWRRPLGVGFSLFLLALLAVRPTFTSIEHLVAYGSGMLAAVAFAGVHPKPVALARADLGRLLAIVCAAVFAVETALPQVSGGLAALALLAVALAITLLALQAPIRFDPLLAALVALGGALALVELPNAATVLALVAALWLLLERWIRRAVVTSFH